MRRLRTLLLIFLFYFCTIFINYYILESEEQEEKLYHRRKTASQQLPSAFSQRDSLYEEEIHFCKFSHDSTSKHKSMCNRHPTSNRKDSVLVVGALHFLGSKLVSHLASEKMTIEAVTSYEDVLHDEHGLVWYRDEMLQDHHGIFVRVSNLTNQTQVEHILTRGTNFSKVVYVPPGLNTKRVGFGHSDGESEWNTEKMMTNALAQFVTLMEVLQKKSPCTKVLLLSRSKHCYDEAENLDKDADDKILMAWMYTFELVLSTYQYLYGTLIGVFRVHSVYGPWGQMVLTKYLEVGGIEPQNIDGHCWFVGEVVELLFQAMQLEKSCQLLELGSCDVGGFDFGESKQKDYLQKSWKWAESYAEKNVLTEGIDGENNVVFTSYFTSTEDSQRKRQKSSNSFRYMEEFYWSLKEMKMNAVIFHDGLNQGFQHRVHSHYPKVTFVEVDSLHGRSTNDARFYAYYKYLREHSEITRVLLTDISDVVFQKNPFQLMSVLGDWLYVGTDIDIFPNMQSMAWLKKRLGSCFGNFSVDGRGELHQLMEMETVYNAGTIGGSRETVLAALMMIVAYLDTTPSKLNCNMPAVNYAIHKYFFEKVFTGFPLNSRFKRWQTAPKGIYLIHK